MTENCCLSITETRLESALNRTVRSLQLSLVWLHQSCRVRRRGELQANFRSQLIMQASIQSSKMLKHSAGDMSNDWTTYVETNAATHSSLFTNHSAGSAAVYPHSRLQQGWARPAPSKAASRQSCLHVTAKVQYCLGNAHPPLYS